MNKITKRIISAVLAFIIIASLAVGAPVSAVEADAVTPETDATVSTVTDGFELQLSNDKYELYYRSDTAEIAVKSKATGYIWYSNPQDRETVAGGGVSFNNLSSQLLVDYFESVEIKSYDSFSLSTDVGQTSFKVEDNTLSVQYDFGVQEFVLEMIPSVISQEYMEKNIFPRLNDEERELVESRYILYDKADMDDAVYDIVVTSYPIIEKHNIYVMSKCPTYIGEKIYNIFVEKAGYSIDDLDEICAENGIENTYKEPATFTAVLDYTLNDDGFNVTLDPKKLKYDEEVPPIQIDVLPFFGAAGTNDSGYMFVPDGSGAIINYNNKKKEADRYWKVLFGNDYSIFKKIVTDTSLPSVLPVFASANKAGGSFYASIDTGYEVAGITAGIADDEYAYNYVRAFFQVVPYDKISIRDKGTEDDTSIKYPAQKMESPINISYHLKDEYSTYDKIAVDYRKHLIENDMLDTKAEDDSYVNVEFYATARVKKNFLGFTYTKLDAITSFDDAQKILEEFGQEKVDTVFTNATAGGKLQSRVSNLKLASVLGSKKDLASFMDSCDTGYISFAARLGNEKTKKSNSSYSLSREITRIYTYDFISSYYLPKKGYSVLLKPSWLLKQAKSVSKALTKKSIDGINLTDIGYRLDSDFNLKDGTNREGIRKLQQSYLETVSKDANVSVNYGSIFSAKYVSKIWNVPMSSSNYAIEDESVPFYQIVLRGSVAYVAPSINQSADARTALLKAAEYGAQIRYSWTAYNAEITRLVDFYENYYDSVYTDTIEQAKSYSVEIKALLEKIENAEIVSHKSISNTLKETKYANGYTVYVNYGKTAVEVEGQTVDAESFVCVKAAG